MSEEPGHSPLPEPPSQPPRSGGPLDTPPASAAAPQPPPAAPRRSLGEISALVSAVSAVLGVVLGFLGLPVFINSPTARIPAAPAPSPSSLTPTTVSPTEVAPPSGQAPPTTTPAPPPSTRPTGEQKSLIRDLHPIETDRSPYDVGPVTVAGITYPNTLHTTCSVATWQLDRKYSSLNTSLAVTETTRSDYTFSFVVEADGRELSSVLRKAGDPVLPLTLDVRGAFRITLRMDSCGEPNGRAAWVDPVVTPY